MNVETCKEVPPVILAEGERYEVSGNFRLLLEDGETVYFLEKGSVNFFSIEKKDGEAEGTRHFLAHIPFPTFLFGMPEVVVITEAPSILWKISLKKIDSYLSERVEILNEWVNRFSPLFSRFMIQECDKYCLAPEELALEDGETVSIKRAVTHEDKLMVNWVEIIQGEVELLGIPDFILGKEHLSFPLTYNGFLKSKGSTRIRVVKTPQNWLDGLHSFYDLFHQFLTFKKEKDRKEELERYQKREKAEEKNINQTLLEMVSLINPIEVEDIYRGKDPLARACQRIGIAMKHPFHIPESLPETANVKVLIEEIAKSSGVRYRQVRLVGNWWKVDAGPLLAFFGPELHPVALLRGKSGHYEMIDPNTNEKKRIDQGVAQGLNPAAYCFYLCFPDKLSKGKEVIQFYLKHYLGDFSSLISYSILVSLISLLPFFAIASLFNRAIPEASIPLVIQITLALLLAAISSACFIFFRTLILVRIEGKSSNFIQLAVWDRLLKLPLSFFRRYSAGNLITRATAIENMRALLSGNAARVIISALFSLFYIIAMIIYAPSLTFIGLILMGISLALTSVCTLFLAKKYKKSMKLNGEINGFLVQIISAVGKLRTVGAEKSAFSHWGKLFVKYKKIELDALNPQNLMFVFNYLLPFLSFICIFSFLMMQKTSLSVGAYIAFNGAFVSFYMAIIDLNQTVLKMAPVYSLWDLSKVIVEEPYEEEGKKGKPGTLTGEISIDEVSFRYDLSSPMVLNNISLKVNPKEFIGIVGSSGCGKSTLIRLLLGFEKPHLGSVYYNELDLASLDIQEVRKQLGIVLQTGGIISGSIFDNIVCGGIFEPHQVERALSLSGFKADVESFPMGIHTILSLGGETLSGGQKQKLLIARALIRNPRILIFDEATSALDNKNQQLISESLDRLDVTRIVIAHRLSTIKNADRIYVLSAGKIIQMGTYETLSQEEGVFSEMLKRQTL